MPPSTRRTVPVTQDARSLSGQAAAWAISSGSAARPGGVAASSRATIGHPVVGLVTVDCDVPDITDRDQGVVICTAAPGSSSEEALRLLSVVGTQRMCVPGRGHRI
ncbi:hypothetical protein J2X68_005770 [Streptomyces sp. 3330]|nr:hypothetical protein [Streptomyces sp. 3330]